LAILTSRESRLAKRLAPWLWPGATVLDLGGGRGKVSLTLQAELDVRPMVSDVMVGRTHPSLPFIHQTDPLHVPLEDGSVDAVVMCYVLHHVGWGDQSALLQEARRLARRRVLIVENVPEQRYERVACRALDWVFNRPFGIPTPFTFRTIEQWDQVAVEMGMTKEHVQRFRLPWPALGLFPDALMVWDLRVLDAVLPQE
jgi:ubiquinone/menaquinone biosynthesis C-methylase UbiE